MSNIWGIDWDNVEDKDFEGPKIGKYAFRITSVKQAVNKNNKPYCNVGAEVIEAEDDSTQIGKVHYEYLSLEPERLGFTKTFFKNCGLDHLLAPDRSPEEAVGALFQGELIETEAANGNKYKNLRHLTPFDYEEDDAEQPDDGEEVDDDDEQPDDDEQEAPKKIKKRRPAPAKSSRGSRRR